MLAMNHRAHCAHSFSTTCAADLARNCTKLRYDRQRSQVTHALPGILGKLFSVGSSKQDPVKQQRRELLRLLVEDTQPDDQTVATLVQALIDAHVPFKESLLGGGPWVVRYTSGTPQLWKVSYQGGKVLNRNNRASQDLNPNGRTVVNRAEYYSGKLYVTASGTYLPEDDSMETPKAVSALISSGSLHLFGITIPLPIRGTGVFQVEYLDDCLRIFRSGGAIAVQVRQDKLESASNVRI